ncbi:isthmin-like [Patiria miniata]|uniref:AMOP domain-containing protein n=1 Tax=Patiria miniata TaxID=46514 RepID=A0A914BF53_PATMI|nr:isthmin-like [Patiria miniata]
MGKLTSWFSFLRQSPRIISMSSVEYIITRVRSTQLRVIFCLLTLFMCISFAEGLDISSGRVVSSRSDTGTGKTSGRVAELVSREDQEKRTGIHKLNKTGSLQDILADEGLPKTHKEGAVPNRRYGVFSGKRSSSRLRTVQTRTAKPKLLAESDGDGMKTWEQLWNEQALPPSLPTSGEIDTDDYYTYDYFEDAEDDDDDEEDEEDEDSKGLSIDRSKKDTSSAESKSHSLDRLAELVTGANPQMGPVNLGTPNPDIEITIEILNGEDAKHEDVVISMDLRDDIVGTPATPDSRRHDGEGAPRPEGETDHDNVLIPPTSKIDEEPSQSEEEPDLGGPDDDDQDSYYSFEFVTLRRLPDPDAINFEPDDPEETIGTWTEWSSCSASCGGGRSERSRSCGFSCMATESKDCNQQACPRGGKSESRPDAAVERPQPPSVDSEYLETVLDPNNFDTDSCEEWMGCRSETLLSYLSRLQDLPNCPCFYPTNLQRNNAIWDRQKRQMFRWMDTSGEDARLDVYKPTASYCIISLLSPHSTSLAAQQCCYDENLRLITRGSGAGTPQLISAEISPELHYKIDIMPWIICKGDWTKYNKVRHPNNMRECRELPDQAEFYRLFQEAKNF